MIDGIPVLDLTARAIASIAVLMVLTGWLVPRRTVNLLQAANEKRDEQVSDLIAQIETSNKMVEALLNVSREDPSTRGERPA